MIFANTGNPIRTPHRKQVNKQIFTKDQAYDVKLPRRQPYGISLYDSAHKPNVNRENFFTCYLKWQRSRFVM